MHAIREVEVKNNGPNYQFSKTHFFYTISSEMLFGGTTTETGERRFETHFGTFGAIRKLISKAPHHPEARMRADGITGNLIFHQYQAAVISATNVLATINIVMLTKAILEVYLYTECTTCIIQYIHREESIL